MCRAGAPTKAADMGEPHCLLSALGVTGDHIFRGTWDESLKTTQEFAQPSPLCLPPEPQGALVCLSKPLCRLFSSFVYSHWAPQLPGSLSPALLFPSPALGISHGLKYTYLWTENWGNSGLAQRRRWEQKERRTETVQHESLS